MFVILRDLCMYESVSYDYLFLNFITPLQHDKQEMSICWNSLENNDNVHFAPSNLCPNHINNILSPLTYTENKVCPAALRGLSNSKKRPKRFLWGVPIAIRGTKWTLFILLGGACKGASRAHKDIISTIVWKFISPCTKILIE